jgi:outer membrane protein OmpA-like peptidoglycan-associated protein
MTERSGGQKCRRDNGLRALALGLLALTLTACSVPDYVNPVNWFDSKEKKQEIAAAKPAPGKDQPYPKLSSVPDRPDPITIARIRKELTEGLIADSKNARYTDEIIRREPPAPPPRPVQVAKAPAPAVAKLSTVKPPPPPKLADAPAPSVTTAAAQDVSETSAATAPTAAAPAKLKVAAAPASAEAPETQQGSAQTAPAKLATSTPRQAKPTTSTAALARPAPPPPPPQLPQLAATAAAQPTGRPAQSAQIATIFFGSATAVLTKDDVAVLREVAALQRETGGTVRVVGHSSRGAPALDRVKQGLLNFKLSLDRANAVAEALTRFGVARDRLDVIARGDGELLYAESSAAGAAGNRRAEIFLEFF